MKRFRLLAPLAMALAIVAGNVPPARAAGPTVSVTSPINNSVQQGTIALTASAGVGTLGVTFKINGVKLGNEDLVAPYTVNWDTKYAPKNPSGFSDTYNKLDYTVTAVVRGLGGSTTSAPVKVKLNNTPFPGTVIVVGDSVSQQAFDPDGDGTFNYTAGAPAEVNRRVFAHMGWTVTNVQSTMNDYSIFRWPEKFVVAMGLNDAGIMFGGDGWTSADTDRFRTLIDTVHPTACVTLVLPGYLATAPGLNPAYVTEINEARAAMAQLDLERPYTRTIDWQTVIDQNPGYMQLDDGIHLATPGFSATDNLAAAAEDRMNPVDPIAAAARQDFYWNGATPPCTI